MRKLILSGAILLASTTLSWAQTTASTTANDTAYCKELAGQWLKYRAGHGSGAGPSVNEYHRADCSNPKVQIPEFKKLLADMGHAVPATQTLTLEQRVQALEQKVNR